ncbi:hypothetical protein Tco_1210658 [Tanacetum coccineum]
MIARSSLSSKASDFFPPRKRLRSSLLHLGVIYKAHARLNQVASNSLMARVETHKSMDSIGSEARTILINGVVRKGASLMPPLALDLMFSSTTSGSIVGNWRAKAEIATRKDYDDQYQMNDASIKDSGNLGGFQSQGKILGAFYSTLSCGCPCNISMEQGSSNDPIMKSSLSAMLHKTVLIASKTTVGQDGIVHSYCGLKLSGLSRYAKNFMHGFKRLKGLSHHFTVNYTCCQLEDPETPTRASYDSRPLHICVVVKPPKRAALTSASVPPVCHNLGPPSYRFSKCDATMWYAERTDTAKRAAHPTFSLCCQEGKLRLSQFNEIPPPLKTLIDYTILTTSKFREQIRVYNSMFYFTSFCANIDHSVNSGRAPYTFRINGQNYHCMGSFLPAEGVPPRYAQLYFFDTQNEIMNRMSAFMEKETTKKVDENTVAGLIQMLD